MAPSSKVCGETLISESGVRNSWLTLPTNSCADVFQFLQPGDIVEDEQLAGGGAGVLVDDGGVDLQGTAGGAVQFQFGVGDVIFLGRRAARAANSCQRKASMMVWPRMSSLCRKICEAIR